MKVNQKLPAKAGFIRLVLLAISIQNSSAASAASALSTASTASTASAASTAPSGSSGAPMEGGFCQQEELKRCTDPLKILTNNRDLGFATTEKELGKLCP